MSQANCRDASYVLFASFVKELSHFFMLRSALCDKSPPLRVTIFRMADKFTVGLIQMSSSKDASANLDRAIGKIREAAKRGAQIVCLDELFCGEYFCRTEEAALFDLAEAIPGPTTDSLAKIARENNVALVISLFERRAAGFYHNSSAGVDVEGGRLAEYGRRHIPNKPLYYEK